MTRMPLGIDSLMKRGLLLLVLFTWFQPPPVWTQSASVSWPRVNFDSGATRYSPLAQITTANVDRLKVAWIYHMKPSQAGTAADSAFRPSEDQPLVVGSTMFVATPYSRVVALDAATGKEKWVFVIPGDDEPTMRGAEYWPGTSPPALHFSLEPMAACSIQSTLEPEK